MTKEELEHWAATNGMTLITTAAFTALCAAAATAIAGAADCDQELRDLLGSGF